MNNLQALRQRIALPATMALLAGTAPAWSDPAPLALPDLLTSTDKALVVLEAEAEAGAARQDVARDRAEQGLRMSLGGGYGLIRNIVDTNRAFTYAGAQAMAGFSYPMLGAAEQGERKVDADLGKQHEKDIRFLAARRMAELELESTYARYWGAQEALKVVRAYLDSEPLVLPKLELRAQHKLMLQSDLLDAQAAYAQAKSDRVQFKRTEDDARNRLQRLTGRQLGEFIAQAVQLPSAPTVDTARLVQRHPDIAALRAQRDALKAQLDDSTWYGLEASLDVNGSGVQDTSQGGPLGGAAFVGLTFKAPVGVFSAGAAERKRLRFEIENVELRMQDRGQELMGEYQAAQEQLVQLQQEGQQMSQRVQASSEGLRESYLRGGAFADEGVDLLARRLQAYYKTALEEVDTQAKGWQANVYLRGYAVEQAADHAAVSTEVPGALGAQLADPIVQVNQMLGGGALNLPSANPPGLPAPAAAPALAPAAPSAAGYRMQTAVYSAPATPAALSDGDDSAAQQAAAGPRLQFAPALGAAAPDPAAGGNSPSPLAVYVWNSADLIAAKGDERLWQGLRAIPVDRLLLGLDARQIEEARTRPQQLRDFLATASQHGVKVELLLGDPSWIEPAQRPKLVAIVQGLQGFGFAGLNLDIEPDQIYKQIDQKHFDDWMETLRAAARVSPWPTGVSIHPRYFRDPPYASWNIAERLGDGGINDVVLMIYNSNPQRVADVAKAIAARAPSLRFRVAQSVEPQLEPQLSYAGRSPHDFQQSMQQLQQLLAPQPNTGGVVVQAWNDLLRMGYESQIR